jgi:SAM-dependent methyltransferase
MSTRPDLADNGNSLTDWVETATPQDRTSKGVNETHLQFLASSQWAQMLEDELMPWVEAAGDLGDHVLEIGPGPGLTTDLLRRRASRVTAIEIDPSLGEPLRERLRGTNVDVIVADAAEADLPENSFSAAACFSILHHMPSAALQDRLFEEIYRVLRPGGIFVGQESLDLEPIRAGHADDVFTPVDPDELTHRLASVGFRATRTDVLGFHFRFASEKPSRTDA